MDKNSEKLRAKAKEELRKRNRIDPSLYETDLKVLVEELSIYQIELEHQNNELIQAQELLQQNRNRYLDLFDNAPIGYLIVDKNGFIKEINSTAALLFEEGKNEMLESKITKHIHPDYQDIFYHYFQALKNQKHPQPCDIKLRKSNKSFFFARIQGVSQSPIFEIDIEYRLAIIDITLQKEMEINLLAAKAVTEHSSKHFQALIEKAPDGIALIDAEGKFKYISESAKKMFGYSPSDEIDINPDANTHPDDLPMVLSELGKIFVDPNYIPTLEYRFLNKQGEWLWIETTFSNLLADENVEAIILNFRDVTERKLNESIFKDIIEKNPLSIQILDMEGYPIQENSAHSKLFGAKKLSNYSVLKDPQLLDKGFTEFFERIKKGEVVHFPDIYYDVHLVDSSFPSNPIWVSALGFTLNDINGKPEKIVLMHENITKQKIAEQELRIAKVHAEESDRLKSAFLANMSHEIRTPMNGILGFAELLKEPGLSGEEQQEYIDIIEKSGVRMLNIINDIIDISKIEANLMKVDIKECFVNNIMEFIYNFFKPQVEEIGVKLIFKNSLTDKKAIIKTDYEKFFSIITNLVKNAIKYTNEGSIEFGYELVETLHESVLKEKSLQFYIKDTGIGIPKDRQSAIFERFIQADISDKMAKQGAGLGLAISKAYVEMLGGKIWVESEERVGSTFYFTLPYESVTE
ncbi:MAG: hypothetical protein CVU04_00030 [Bacteroidetes bacterium HGW-Bacteroidetes-20]|nr:MAG: hypothetical protein CVU04_00030 [Bacteroidetes bacterium HGW-Bacteroidetes-20]